MDETRHVHCMNEKQAAKEGGGSMFAKVISLGRIIPQSYHCTSTGHFPSSGDCISGNVPFIGKCVRGKTD
jgi:hypothetical protein